MIWYTAQRLLWSVAVLVVTTAVLFCLIYVIPGDPISMALGPRATDAMRAELVARMGLDKPVFEQLWHFIAGAFTGDLGIDMWSKRPIADVVLTALPSTLMLASIGLGWAIVVGIPLGCWAALHKNGLADRVLGLFAAVTIALPSFVVAIYGLLIFSVQLKWLPALGAGADGDVADQLRRLILPSFAIGLTWVGFLARLVRASMIEVLSENHIRMLRAFGLGEGTILLRYALPIAVVPTVTIIGMGFGSLLSGAVLIEIVFNRPGIGKLTYDAVTTRNFPLLTGCVLVTTACYVLCTVAADLVVARLDPRVRKSL